MPDKRIGSFKELFEVISKLEIDEGVRVLGKVGVKKCYIFVTKSSNGYTVAVFEVKDASRKLGKQLIIEDSMTYDKVKMFIERNCDAPLRAYRY